MKKIYTKIQYIDCIVLFHYHLMNFKHYSGRDKHRVINVLDELRQMLKEYEDNMAANGKPI